MLSLEVFGRSEPMRAVTDELEAADGIRHVTIVDAAREDHVVVRARVAPRVVRRTLERLRVRGVPEQDITVARVDRVLWAQPGSAPTVLEWDDVVGTARANVRLTVLYLAFMFAAGVIACYGVVDANGILIVGAMALSPDLLPIAAIGVGLVARNGVALRGLGAIVAGMAAAVLAATIFSFAQDQLDLLPSGFDLDSSVLGSLSSINNETIVVAFVAGAAGMLALETRAMTAVGVAISVTTIPAAAYVGVAIGTGSADKAGGGVAVLAMNVLMMSLGAATALFVQRALQCRAGLDAPVGEP